LARLPDHVHERTVLALDPDDLLSAPRRAISREYARGPQVRCRLRAYVRSSLFPWLFDQQVVTRANVIPVRGTLRPRPNGLALAREAEILGLMFPSIGDYYRLAMDGIRKEVREASDARALGLDATEWVDHLVRKYEMEPIKADMAAIKMEETTSYHGSPAILVTVPVELVGGLLQTLPGAAQGQTTQKKELELRGLLHRQVGGLGALEDLLDLAVDRASRRRCRV